MKDNKKIFKEIDEKSQYFYDYGAVGYYISVDEVKEIIKKYVIADRWIPVSEGLPKACYKSGNSEEVLITLGWFYDNGELSNIDSEQYIGYFNEGLFNDYIESEEDEGLEMEEILNDCWNVYEKGHLVTVDLTTNRRVIAWKPLPLPYKED